MHGNVLYLGIFIKKYITLENIKYIMVLYHILIILSRLLDTVTRPIMLLQNITIVLIL